MASYCAKYSFSDPPPELELIRAQSERRSGKSFFLASHQSQPGTYVLHSGEEALGVGLVRGDADVTVHCGFKSRDFQCVRDALEELGGIYPPLRVLDDRLDYGECWLGILAEGDDYIFHGLDSRFRLWSQFLGEELPASDEIHALQEFVWDGGTHSIRPATLASQLNHVLAGELGTWGEHQRVALQALVDYLLAQPKGSRMEVTIE